MKGFWISRDVREIRDFPVPSPGEGEVLIKNVVVASNPKDCKISKHIPDWESIEGNDVAGYIEAVGPGVTDFKKGDKVAALSKIDQDPKYGGYAEYTVAPAVTTIPLGPDTSFEEAATLPLDAMTAAIGLFVDLGLPKPPSDIPKDRREGLFSAHTDPPSFAILVNGIHSAVGLFAVQLARLADARVVGIPAGSVNEQRTFPGAPEVVDYKGNSPEGMSQAIQAAVQKYKIFQVFDAVGGSARALTQGLQPDGGKIVSVLPPTEGEAAQIPPNVDWIVTRVGKAYGRESGFGSWFCKQLGRWVQEGLITPAQYTVIPGGLEGVKEGLRKLEAGEGDIKGHRFVYRINETPGLEG